jgi:predicted CopG family antitoxin
MRTTIDIPDALYRELKSKAARDKRSVKELILRSVEVELRPRSKKRTRRVTFPLVPSKKPGTLDIDNAKIYELISFP